MGAQASRGEVKIHVGGGQSPHLLKINPHASVKALFTLASLALHGREDHSLEEQEVT